MSIVITGATGQLGRHVVEALLQRNVPAAEIVATGRSIEKLADFAARGVQVRPMDYSDAASVAQALERRQQGPPHFRQRGWPAR